MMNMRDEETTGILLFGVSAVSVLVALHRGRHLRGRPKKHRIRIAGNSLRSSTSSTDSESSFVEQDDAVYLEQAHELRLSLEKPQHSDFRVVALLLMDDGSVIEGANDEPSPTLAGSICAERGAFLRLRVQESLKGTKRQVKTVYIVTDAVTPIPPGTLCREYMYGHAACSPETRVVMQSAQSKEHAWPWIVTMRELYPYPSIYMGLNVKEQLQLGHLYANEHVQDDVSLELSGLSQRNIEVDRLVEAAQKATKFDDRDVLHAMRYGAAAALLLENDTIEIVTASQRKAVEYGASLDAVTQLVPQLFKSDGTRQKLLAITLVDQFGVAHAPFAAARGFLVEHGFGDCVCILIARGENGKLYRKAVPANDLGPFVPEIHVAAADESKKNQY
jgi:cytidine deaminase